MVGFWDLKRCVIFLLKITFKKKLVWLTCNFLNIFYLDEIFVSIMFLNICVLYIVFFILLNKFYTCINLYYKFILINKFIKYNQLNHSCYDIKYLDLSINFSTYFFYLLLITFFSFIYTIVHDLFSWLCS
jgi:hypothetical protein